MYLICAVVLGTPLSISARSSEQAKEVLTKPSEKLTEEDFKEFVELAWNEEINGQEVSTFLNNLSTDQLKQIKLVAEELHPVPPPNQEEIQKHWVDQADEHTITDPARSDAPNAGVCDPGVAPLGLCWKQSIEESYYISNSMSTPRRFYTNAFSCDDADVDYIFYFSRDATDPDRLRWWSASGWVQFLVQLENAPNSFGFNLYEVRLCLGDGTVSWAGGANTIMQNLHVMYP